MGWRCSSGEPAKIDLIFKAFDVDKNGIIDHDEFVLMITRLNKVGMSERKTLTRISEMFVEIDTNKDGRIDSAEFSEWAVQVRQNSTGPIALH